MSPTAPVFCCSACVFLLSCLYSCTAPSRGRSFRRLICATGRCYVLVLLDKFKEIFFIPPPPPFIHSSASYPPSLTPLLSPSFCLSPLRRPQYQLSASSSFSNLHSCFSLLSSSISSSSTTLLLSLHSSLQYSPITLAIYLALFNSTPSLPVPSGSFSPTVSLHLSSTSSSSLPLSFTPSFSLTGPLKSIIFTGYTFCSLFPLNFSPFCLSTSSCH